MRHNVVHLIDTGGPGGAETIFSELVTGLDPGRFRSVAVVPVRDWLHSHLVGRGLDPVVIESRGASFDVRYAAAIYALLKRTRADIVQTHLLSSSVYATLAASLTHIPVVCTFHGHVDVAADERFGAAKFRILRRRRNRVVFVSEGLRDAFVERGRVAPERASVVYNGIDTNAFTPGRDSSLRDALNIGAEELLIGAVGNVRRSKAYDVLLRAAALLRDRGVACRIVIVGQTSGSGALYDELLSLHASLGLDNRVVFAGFHDDIPAVMRNFDVYVNSSSEEGFSLTVVQALATGLPVLATRSGGPEEILENGVTGVLVPRASPESLADGLAELVADPAARSLLAARARGTADKRFRLQAMVDGYQEVYDRMLGGSTGRGA